MCQKQSKANTPAEDCWAAAMPCRINASSRKLSIPFWTSRSTYARSSWDFQFQFDDDDDDDDDDEDDDDDDDHANDQIERLALHRGVLL